MSTKIDGIIIGGIEIQPEAGVEFSQSYSSRRRSAHIPLASGRVLRQTLDGSQDKIISSITGTGWMPLGLNGIDTTVTQVVKCGGPVSKTSASNIIEISPKRRTDSGFEPVGFAIVGGISEPVEITDLTGDTATLATTAGATAYGVQWFPEFTAWIDIQDQGVAANSAEYPWSILATEE